MMKKMKNNNINKTGLIIGAFCLIMVSCKAPSLTPTEKIELPKFYMDRETDSTTISSMSWKTFFPDTLLQSYIAEALNNNHSFLQTIERISIARSQVRVGKGALLPDLSLGIDGGVARFSFFPVVSSILKRSFLSSERTMMAFFSRCRSILSFSEMRPVR
jgi:outer membrane protein TolC